MGFPNSQLKAAASALHVQKMPTPKTKNGNPGPNGGSDRQMTSQFDAENDATKRKQTSPASEEDASRRKFLNIAAGGAIAGLVTTAGLKFSAPRAGLAPSRLNPDQAPGLFVEGHK